MANKLRVTTTVDLDESIWKISSPISSDRKWRFDWYEDTLWAATREELVKKIKDYFRETGYTIEGE